MKLSMDEFKKNRIILRRNREEEINNNYTKIYDLSKINEIENISFEDKRNLLITIKKILLCTNEYIISNNILEIIRYILLSSIIFILFIIIFCPIYKSYFYFSNKQLDSSNESSFFQKFYCYFFFEVLEIIFRIVFNNIKKRKIKKIMKNYAQNIIRESQKENNFYLYFDDNNFNLFIIKKIFFNIMFKIKENISFYTETKNNFYQYVINYPNVRFYNWDRKILNEKENEIANNIIQAIKLTEKEHVKKFGFTVVIVWTLYFLSFKSLIRGEKLKSLFYRFIIFVLTKIVSLIMSYNYKNNLKEKEEILCKQYIASGYFIVLSFTVIQIFKLKDEYVDNTLNIDELYKNINKDVVHLNEKIVESNK